MKLYSELAEWWPLMSAPEEYAEEAVAVAGLLAPVPGGAPPRVLELGSGGGHLASHLKRRFQMTLLDRSPRMLDLSRRLNPECRHVEGDMRKARLGELFDSVLVFDAVSHLRAAEDLQAAIETARAHLAAGGTAVFCPDATVETFRPGTTTGGTDGAGRGMRYLEWTHPEVYGTAYLTHIAYLLREADGHMRHGHDHVWLGLFSRAHWKQALIKGGFESPQVHQISARDVMSARAKA